MSDVGAISSTMAEYAHLVDDGQIEECPDLTSCRFPNIRVTGDEALAFAHVLVVKHRRRRQLMAALIASW